MVAKREATTRCPRDFDSKYSCALAGCKAVTRDSAPRSVAAETHVSRGLGRSACNLVKRGRVHPLSAQVSKGAPIYLCTLGRAYALSGNLDEARRIASQVGGIEKESRGSGAALSALFLALGNPEDALRWLEETAPGDIQANWLRVEPAFDPLRGNPRFEAVVRHIEMGQR
jgi:hypothetical protein